MRRAVWYARHRELAWSLAAGALLAIGFALSRAGVAPPAVIPIYLGSYAFGAFDLVRHAFGRVRQGRFSFDIDLLMLLAALGAAMLGEWAEGAFLLFLFSLAHALEHYALGRARASIRALGRPRATCRSCAKRRPDRRGAGGTGAAEAIMCWCARRNACRWTDSLCPGSPPSIRRRSPANRYPWTRPKATTSSRGRSMVKAR